MELLTNKFFIIVCKKKKKKENSSTVRRLDNVYGYTIIPIKYLLIYFFNNVY